jgi:hypothetical protein
MLSFRTYEKEQFRRAVTLVWPDVKRSCVGYYFHLIPTSSLVNQ